MVGLGVRQKNPAGINEIPKKYCPYFICSCGKVTLLAADLLLVSIKPWLHFLWKPCHRLPTDAWMERPQTQTGAHSPVTSLGARFVLCTIMVALAFSPPLIMEIHRREMRMPATASATDIASNRRNLTVMHRFFAKKVISTIMYSFLEWPLSSTIPIVIYVQWKSGRTTKCRHL